ncbi:MAG: PX domain-containing protein [archaeon]|nr:PX domain-containing protein [archaeon]
MEPSKGYRIMISNHLKQADHVEYLITIVSMNDPTLKVEFYERYSNLKSLNDILRKETTSGNFPKFPPKKFFGSTDEKFLNQRQVELNTYFTLLMDGKDFCQLPSLKKWIDDALKKHSAVKNDTSLINPKTEKTNVKNASAENQNVKKGAQSKEEIKKNKEAEIARINAIIDECKDKLIELEKPQPQDQLQEDEEKIKEYNELCKKENLFGEADLESSKQLFIKYNREENFNEDQMKEAKYDEELSTKAEEKLKNFNKEFYDELEKIYDTKDLIISF